MIRKRARTEGNSLNKMIKNLLKESLGLAQTNMSDHREEFLDLFGSWRKSDTKEFDESLKDFNMIEPEQWQ